MTYGEINEIVVSYVKNEIKLGIRFDDNGEIMRRDFLLKVNTCK